MSMIRTAFARQARLFSTSPIVRKTIAENVQDAAKAVDRTVADAAVKGIETGEQATEAAKQAMGINSEKAAGEASKMAGEAQGKAAELTGQAKGAANEMAGKAKGTAEEVKSKM